MELKVWVEGAVRVVCGLSPDTSCRDIVIALARAIGQTGRYILVLNLCGNERQLLADDLPLQHLARLGQLAPEVQFILRRTGPSHNEGRAVTSNGGRNLPLLRTSRPEPHKHQEPHRALTFNLGPSTLSRTIEPNGAWSPSPGTSPEPGASPVPSLDAPSSVRAAPPQLSKEEVFKQILQQQRRLHNLEMQLQALELETEVWEQERSSVTVPGLTPGLAEELRGLEELGALEQWLRESEAELMHGAHWEEELQEETDREREMHRRLQQIHSSMDDHSDRIEAMQARSAHLEQDVRLTAQRQRQQEEALMPLRQELHSRLQQGEDLDASLSETQRELRAAEEWLQDRRQQLEELNRELRECDLRRFVQQTGGPNAGQTNPLPASGVYLSNAGILE